MMHFRRTLWSIVQVACFLILSDTAYTQKSQPDVEFVPTPQEVVAEMLKMAGVTKDDMVYDLGCGDGRIVITAVKQFGARGVGVDIDPFRISESNENAQKAGVAERVKFLEQDLFKTDISEATVVTLYLLSELNLRLRPKLFRELRPGTRIVSNDFDMGDWKPDKMSVVRNVTYEYPDAPQVRNGTVYYWVIPANVAGLWRWSVATSKGERQYTLRLEQKFQEVSGEVSAKEREITLADVRLVGDQLSFTIRDKMNGQTVMMQFNGRISSNSINGSIDVKGGPFAGHHIWTAKRNP